MAQPSLNWSDILKSDLDKLAQVTAAHGKIPTAKLKEGERRIVTILFLDIQGFTAMSEKLDPEDVQLIIDNCFKILTNEIEKYQGYIDKYEGDRMMALFGSREASEQDCERALRAALGMKEKFLDVNRILAQQNIKIGIRIGVNSGLVVTGHVGKERDQDFTVMGDAVNLASRLETNAPPNEILISEEVKRTAGELFIYEDLGKIEVKGKKEPLSVYCVKEVNPAHSERWERSPFTRRSQYVRREREHQKLKESADRAASGGGIGSIALSGQAGVGKSRMVYEFVRSYVSQEGKPSRIVRCRALAFHPTPYGLFSDLLGRVLSDDELSPVILAGAERLAPTVKYLAGQGELDERLRALDPAALRVEIHLAIRTVLEQLAAYAKQQGEALMIVHLDDIQWADQASLDVIEFLGSALERETPILFIWTHRPDFSFKPEVQEAFQTEIIQLKPLSENECGKILKSVLEGIHLTGRDHALVIQRCGGNPFFLEELIQSLIEDGTLAKKGEKWILTHAIEEASLPETVQRILLARIDKLDREHKETLMAASVVGEIVPLVVLEFVWSRMNVSHTVTKLRLNVLEDLGFVYRRREEGVLGAEIAFRHGLTREVVYSMILNHNKKILHELVGRAFEKAYADRAEEQAPLLFHHFSSAGMQEETLKYGFLGLDQMVRKYAIKEGLDTVEVLRPLLDHDPAAQARILEVEVRLNDFWGRRPEQLRVIELLDALNAAHPNLNLAARVAAQRAAYFNAVGDFRGTKQSAESALELLKTSASDERLEIELYRSLGIACYSTQDHPKALEVYQRGLRLAEKLKDRSAEGAFYNAIGLVHFNSGKPNEALPFYEKAYALMNEMGDRRGQANAVGNQGLVYWTLGEYSRALNNLEESHKIFQEIGFRKGQAATLGNIGVIHHKLGQYAKALECYQSAIALRREIHDRAGEGYDLVNIGVAYQHMGDYQKALEHFDAGIWLTRDVGVHYLLSENLNGMAIVYRKLGETDPKYLARSKEAAVEALSIAQNHKLIAAEIKARSNLARTLWLLGEKEEALKYSWEAMKLIETHTSGVEGSEEDAYINHYHLLLESGQTEEALAFLGTLVRLIKTRAERIKEKEYRKSFLEEVRQNRYALEEWRKHQLR